MRTKLSLGPLILLRFGLFCSLAGAEEPAATRPNITFIMADDMGYGALPGDFVLDAQGRKISKPGRNWVFDEFDHKSCGDFRGSKAHIWDGGHRVPLIVRWPRKVKPATVSDETLCLTDFVATSAAIVGADLPDDAAEDSINITCGTSARTLSGD